MKKFLWLIFLLAACTPTQAPSSQKQMISVQATPATTPWLAELYSCAERSNAAVQLTSDAPDIFLRLGEPGKVTSPVYQIGEDELLIVTHRDSTLPSLSLEDVQALFAGQNTAAIWVYSSDADIQVLFDQLVMKGRSVSSFAKVAFSPEKMSKEISADPNSVGILPRKFLEAGGNLREVYSAGSVPVLAMTKVEVAGMTKDVLSCLSK